MKNIKKITASVALSALIIGGSVTAALPTRSEKIGPDLASAVIAPTVLTGAAYMLKKYMDTMDTASLSKLFGAKVLQLKTVSAVGLTAGVIAAAFGLHGMKKSLTPKEKLGFFERCKKFSKNTVLVGASALATAGCYKVLATSARDVIKASVDTVYNVKACMPLIISGMVATGALLGYYGLREAWDGIRNKGCASSEPEDNQRMHRVPSSSIVRLEEGLARVADLHGRITF